MDAPCEWLSDAGFLCSITSLSNKERPVEPHGPIGRFCFQSAEGHGSEWLFPRIDVRLYPHGTSGQHQCVVALLWPGLSRTDGPLRRGHSFCFHRFFLSHDRKTEEWMAGRNCTPRSTGPGRQNATHHHAVRLWNAAGHQHPPFPDFILWKSVCKRVTDSAARTLKAGGLRFIDPAAASGTTLPDSQALLFSRYR